MVGLRETGSDHAFSALAREVDIQQAIPVQVRKFTPAPREANAAKAMAAWPDARKPARSNLQRLQGRESVAVKQRRPCQEERVQNLRRERHPRQPAQTPDDELEYHGWISARRLMCRITRKCTA